MGREVGLIVSEETLKLFLVRLWGHVMQLTISIDITQTFSISVSLLPTQCHEILGDQLSPVVVWVRWSQAITLTCLFNRMYKKQHRLPKQA